MVPSLYGIGLDIDAFFSKRKKWLRSKLPGGNHGDVETTTP
jgi:hypothetical protein